MSLVLNIGLALLLLGLAVWTIVCRETFNAVVGFIAYGLLLTLAWVQLQGVDVALTEAAIGGGLTGVLLIRAAARLRSSEAAGVSRASTAVRALAAGVSIAVTVALGLCVLALPDPAPTLAHDVMLNMPATDVGNPITAVLLAFRAMDTLLEAIVLLFALVGVWSLAPDSGWGGRPTLRLQPVGRHPVDGHPVDGRPEGPHPADGRPVDRHPVDPNGILAYLARVLPPIGIVVGIYVFWNGADHPGGKFQGATILAAMWLLVMLAGLADAPPISRTWLRLGLVAGPLLFILVGFAGVRTAGAFLGYPEGLAKPLIVAIELALLPSLTLVLGLLLLGAPQRGAPPRGEQV